MGNFAGQNDTEPEFQQMECTDGRIFSFFIFNDVCYEWAPEEEGGNGMAWE